MRITLDKECPRCEGNGVAIIVSGPGSTTEEDPCVKCGGTGKFSNISFESLPENVFEAYKVLECLDATEHNALTDTQKEGVKVILMCGAVDLNDGKVGITRLSNWFGAESTTVANLTALLA